MAPVVLNATKFDRRNLFQLLRTLKSLAKRVIGKRATVRLNIVRRNWADPRFKDRPWEISLRSVGCYFGTDKGNQLHAFNGISYLDIYEVHLKRFRKHDVSILEIGVKDGASLRMWKHYFSKGRIYGVDIDPRCTAFEEERIAVEIGSQDDVNFLKHCFGTDVLFDIIIDDGSHVNHMTITAFEYLFNNRLSPGGIYIIEDLGCSYEKLDSVVNVRAIWPGMDYNDKATSLDNSRIEIDKFFSEKLKNLDHLHGDVQSMHFYAMTCVLEKVTTPTS